jgi:hypothetical protein
VGIRVPELCAVVEAKERRTESGACGIASWG